MGQVGEARLAVRDDLTAHGRRRMSDGGALHVSVRRAGDEAVVRVTDTGPGIPPEILGDLFKPFVTTKGARARSSIPGMGLGLCACDGILASHQGSISVASEPGRGTTFTVRLPIVSLATTRDEGAPGEAPKA